MFAYCLVARGAGSGMNSGMTDETFRVRFLEALERSGLSVAELSRRSGVDYHAIDKLKKREGASTSADRAKALARVLGFDYEQDPDQALMLDLFDQLTPQERHAVMATARGMLALRGR